MNNLQIGQIYYKEKDDGELDIVRVHSKKNGLVLSRGVNKSRVDSGYLYDYSKLNPDGVLYLKGICKC